MNSYGFLHIPDSCLIQSTIYKKLFYENASLSSSDKALFTTIIDKIVWLYSLKTDTIHIPSYKDDVREYLEIEIIEVSVHKEHKLDRIADIIMRTIPYPMLLFFRMNDKKKLYMAHQKTSLSDSSKNTLEEFVATDWLESNNGLFSKLAITSHRFTNFFDLYSDLLDAVSVFNVSDSIDTSHITGEEARILSAKLKELEDAIISLRSKLNKENQFNRKMDLHVQIKKLIAEKDILLKKDSL